MTNMPIGEWLGWATGLIQDMGLSEIIPAGFVILLAAAAIKRLFGGSGD